MRDFDPSCACFSCLHFVCLAYRFVTKVYSGHSKFGYSLVPDFLIIVSCRIALGSVRSFRVPADLSLVFRAFLKFFLVVFVVSFQSTSPALFVVTVLDSFPSETFPIFGSASSKLLLLRDDCSARCFFLSLVRRLMLDSSVLF